MGGSSNGAVNRRCRLLSQFPELLVAQNPRRCRVIAADFQSLSGLA
jgi:hypothetical protein